MSNHCDVFSQVYEGKVWGTNNDPKYSGSSGGGSSLEYNQYTYIPLIQNFCKVNEVKSVVDCGCGDWRFGEYLWTDPEVQYSGFDAYDKVIEANKERFAKPYRSFTHLDFFNGREELPAADLCIIKDVLQHWSEKEIYEWLDYIVESKKFKYVIITNCNYQKPGVDIKTGDFRPLNCLMYPLKKYEPKLLMRYGTKDVCLVKCGE